MRMAISFQVQSDSFYCSKTMKVWGTCQGFQLMSILGAEDEDVLIHNAFDSENLPLPLHFTESAPSVSLPIVQHLFHFSHHRNLIPVHFILLKLNVLLSLWKIVSRLT